MSAPGGSSDLRQCAADQQLSYLPHGKELFILYAQIEELTFTLMILSTFLRNHSISKKSLYLSSKLIKI